MQLLRLCAIGASIALAGCASMKVSDFAAGRPTFDPARFFTGQTRSSGVLENRSGAPKLRVRTETSGRWKDGVLYLEQDLFLSDGKQQQQHRSWRIRRLDRHHFEATANDVVGTIRGEARGNAFHWSFTLALSPGNPLANVGLSQWMYLQPDGRSMLNHTTIRKFGVVVAQVSELFRRAPD